MKPQYANTFGIRKVTDKEGEVLEVTLDITYKFMETAITITPSGLENVSTPNAEPVASVVMNRQSAISLRNLLIQTLGTEARPGGTKRPPALRRGPFSVYCSRAG